MERGPYPDSPIRGRWVRRVPRGKSDGNHQHENIQRKRREAEWRLSLSFGSSTYSLQTNRNGLDWSLRPTGGWQAISPLDRPQPYLSPYLCAPEKFMLPLLRYYVWTLGDLGFTVLRIYDEDKLVLQWRKCELFLCELFTSWGTFYKKPKFFNKPQIDKGN